MLLESWSELTLYGFGNCLFLTPGLMHNGLIMPKGDGTFRAAAFIR